MTKMSAEEQAGDEQANCVLVAGMVWTSLTKAGVDVEPVVDGEGQVTGALMVRFPYMESPYRLTLERIKE